MKRTINWLLLAATVSTPSVFSADGPGLEFVKVECRYERLCNPNEDWGVEGRCTVRALVGPEAGTGQMVSEIVLESKAVHDENVESKVVRKAIVANWNSDDIHKILVEPIKYGTVQLEFDASAKKGTVRFMGMIGKGTLISQRELRDVPCTLF